MKKIFIRAIIIVAFMAMSGLFFQGKNGNAAVRWDTGKFYQSTSGGFTFNSYLSTDGKKAWIYKVKNLNKDVVPEKLIFPEKIGRAKVVRIGAEQHKDSDGGMNIFGGWEERFHDIDGSTELSRKIKVISMPDTVTEIVYDAFFGMYSLEKVKVPDNVKALKQGTFADCKNLREVKLPKKLSSFSSHCFKNCQRLKKLTISSKNKKYTVKNNVLLSDGKKKLCWVVPNHETIRIPDSVQIIKTGAFGDSQATKVQLGKNVTKIQGNSITGSNIKNIVLGKNIYFAKHKGCIYRKSDKTLAIGIVKKKKLIISNKVKRLTKDTSLCGDLGRFETLKVLDIPSSVKLLGKDWFRYMGFGSPEKTYFRGKRPPKLQLSHNHYSDLPTFGEVYVPEKSLKAYQSWYKKAGELEYVEEDSWNTF